MARHNPAELLTGAVVLAVAALFGAYALANTGTGFSGGGYDLRAQFDHVDGLSVGTDVRIAGVKVGSIQSISLNPKTYLADVVFSVQKGLQLSTDTSATVSTDGLLGGKYLALATGGEDKMLKPGDAVTITEGSINLESLIGKYIFPSVGKSGSAAPKTSDGIAPLK